MDALNNPQNGYVLRGGRMFTMETFECLFDMFKDVPSMLNKGQSVTTDIKEFHKVIQTHNNTRLVNKMGIRVDVADLGLSTAHKL